MNIQPYVVINGKSSREILGLMITTLPPIVKPPIRAEADAIDGRDGDVITRLGFSAYDKPLGIALYGDYDVDDVIDFFNQEGEIIFSNEPDKFYKFQQLEGIEFEKLIRYKTAQIKLHCQPFKYSVSEAEKVFTFSSSESSGELSIRNVGNYYAKPTIKLTGSGNINLSLNGAEVMLIDMSSDGVIILNTDEMNAYNPDGILKNRKTTGNMEHLFFKIGKNVLSYTGNITQISISNFSRWI